MSDYSDLPSYGSGSRGSGSADKNRVMEQMKSQMAVAYAQALIEKMSGKCFHKCVIYPGSELDSREQKCLSSCIDRYMEAWNTISKAYSSRLQKDRHL